MKIHNKRELQYIAINHSADIDYKDFMKVCKICKSEPYSFLNVNTIHLRFTKILLDSL